LAKHMKNTLNIRSSLIIMTSSSSESKRSLSKYDERRNPKKLDYSHHSKRRRHSSSSSEGSLDLKKNAHRHTERLKVKTEIKVKEEPDSDGGYRRDSNLKNKRDFNRYESKSRSNVDRNYPSHIKVKKEEISDNERHARPSSVSGRYSQDKYRSGRRNDRFDRRKNEQNYAWGKREIKVEANNDAPPKEKPNFEVTGALASDTNSYKGVVIKYTEPPEARKPKLRWSLYPFKGEEALPLYRIHRQSAYLFGRDRRIADIPIDHPSCSKQHAVFQYRSIPETTEDGRVIHLIKPYLIDLGSANGTYLNGDQLEAQRYYQLFEKDVIKFGYSSREYVLLNEKSADNDSSSSMNDSPPDVKVKLVYIKTVSLVQPLPCANHAGNFICHFQHRKPNFVEHCKRSRLFGRFYCCKSCAAELGIVVKEDGSFEDLKNFTYYDPTCPDIKDRAVAEGRENVFCDLHMVVPVVLHCSMPDMQYSCAKTCNITCGVQQGKEKINLFIILYAMYFEN
ncbi:Smad nuclear interacting protein 1, partial [Trichinella papuae]